MAGWSTDGRLTRQRSIDQRLIDVAIAYEMTRRHNDDDVGDVPVSVSYCVYHRIRACARCRRYDIGVPSAKRTREMGRVRRSKDPEDTPSTMKLISSDYCGG
jgi:hypothetical protein